MRKPRRCSERCSPGRMTCQAARRNRCGRLPAAVGAFAPRRRSTGWSGRCRPWPGKSAERPSHGLRLGGSGTTARPRSPRRSARPHGCFVTRLNSESVPSSGRRSKRTCWRRRCSGCPPRYRAKTGSTPTDLATAPVWPSGMSPEHCGFHMPLRTKGRTSLCAAGHCDASDRVCGRCCAQRRSRRDCWPDPSAARSHEQGVTFPWTSLSSAPSVVGQGSRSGRSQSTELQSRVTVRGADV